ncbi:MAG: aminopeptidase P family protein [Bacteroidales bacterium]|nr:aminopeptidase P family protein [Bacteroidales bacterium]MDD3989992.1 aminopeptidase P family protein [Bacteroidales bacterium]MDD4638176.1 aminopeptidase P family protein [Bacteroidales bacterium]
MFNRDVYVNRRNTLKSSVKSGILLFLGNSEVGFNYPSNGYKFRQDSNFLYFFGLDEPDLAAAIDVESGEEIVFGNDVDIDDIIWMGPQPAMKDKAAKVGIEKVYQRDKLTEYIGKAVKGGRKIHYLPPYRDSNRIILNQMLGIPFDGLKSGASAEFIQGVVALREIKSREELAEMDDAANIGYAMHYTAMKMIRTGMVEQELVGVMEGIAQSQGHMSSFPIILSQNGETLHNHSHHQIITDGRLLVIDAGAENNAHYASDFTRTLPCGGKFTTRQSEIYTIVSQANNLAISLVKPGVSYRTVHLAAIRLITQGLKNLGLMKGDIDEAVAAGATALFMPHGLGHQLGMDVHDMEDLGENFVGYDNEITRAKQFGLASLRMGKVLKPGHVITVEPGCYFIPALIDKWKREGTNTSFINFDKLQDYYNFGGIRLEDDVAVTQTGCRLLGSERLPITVEDVQREMK